MKYDIFISYSRDDAAIVNEVVAALKSAGFSIWIDKDGIYSGDAFKSVIVNAIDNSDTVLFFSSESANASPWTTKEIAVAIFKHKRVIPIRLDDSSYSAEIMFDLVNLDYDLSDRTEINACVERLIKTLGSKPKRGSSGYGSVIPPPCNSCAPGIGKSIRIGSAFRGLCNTIGGLFFAGIDAVIEFLRNSRSDFVCDESISNAESDNNTFIASHNDDQSNINACVYAPAEVCPHKSFIIRVYMYLPEEQNAVDSKIKEIDPTAVKKEYKPLDLPVKDGDKLTVQLKLSEGVECKDISKSVLWHNHYTDCSFMAKLVDANQDCIEGAAYLFVNDVPAGEMLFTIDVVESEPRQLYTNVESRRFSKIFISYAHKDESQVWGIAEGCRILGKDYFFDRHTLQPGDLFKEKILNYIDSADLFVLCWSKNAAESEWVQIERKHALQLIRERKSKLSIYALSICPEAPMPEDMPEYHFGKIIM